MPSSTIYHIQTRIPARSSRNDGDGGPNNVPSLTSRSSEKEKLFFGARTSRRIQMVSPPTFKASNSSGPVAWNQYSSDACLNA